MKKVGIISYYYENYNYGALLQAFALVKSVQDLNDYSCELITYKPDGNSMFVKKTRFSEKIKKIISGNFKYLIQTVFYKYLKKTIEKIMNVFYSEKLGDRANKVKMFRDSIPHSSIITAENLNKISNIYDVFLSGSDQIWKPSVVDDAYVFNIFEDSEDKKNVFSYASSVAVSSYPEEYLEFMKQSLEKYSNISMREKDNALFFEKYLGTPVKWVVDPTFLIDRKEWDKLASEKLIADDYIFCYLLGTSKKQRKIVEEYSKTKGLKLVTLPHMSTGHGFQFRIEDYRFGDIQMYDVGVPEFLSLIKYANIVITDSFHATVMSYMFKCDFYTLVREVRLSEENMDYRIYSLMEIFGGVNRIIHNSNDLLDKKYEKLDYTKMDSSVQKYVENSKDYLRNALCACS